MSKNLFCLYKNLNPEFTLFITCVAIDSPESVSSRIQHRHVTFVYKYMNLLSFIFSEKNV